jgi:hypothetical protein
MRNGGRVDGSSGGVVGNPHGVESVVLESRIVIKVGEGVEDRREPALVDRVTKITSSSSNFFHSVWRVKGIIPSILHPVMLCSLLKAISHAGFTHFMKCS